MNAKELRSKPIAALNDELLKLRKEQFSLRMQRATGQTVKPTDFSRVRKDVARLKTIVREQQIAAGSPAAVAKPVPVGKSTRVAKSGRNEKRK
jgi:large subunit ribosomal protein L29